MHDTGMHCNMSRHSVCTNCPCAMARHYKHTCLAWHEAKHHASTLTNPFLLLLLLLSTQARGCSLPRQRL